MSDIDATHATAHAVRESPSRLTWIKWNVINNWICHPAIGRSASLLLRDRIPSSGLVVDTSSPSVAPKIKARLLWGLYEKPEVRFVEKYLRSDLDVIELGSSLGIVACHIRRRLAAKRKLICVEANPALIPIIRRNLQLNTPGRSAVVLNAGIRGESSGATRALLAVGRSNLGARIVDRGSEGERVMSVPTTSLTRILAEHDISEYVLVSDIEGAEAEMVQEDQGALRGCRQMIIELHDARYNGRHIALEQIYDKLVNEHHFAVRDRRHAVFVLER